MTTLTLNSEHHYKGDKVVVRVRLLQPRITTRVDMTLDTGAEVSVLNRDLVGPLGLTIEDGDSITVMVANGEVAQAWIHPIDIEFLGRRLTIPVAICPEWDTQNLLGMRGFFDQMIVAFDHANRTIHF